MSVCTEPVYTCPEFGTKKQTASINGSLSHTYTQNTNFTLSYGTTSLDINKRIRSYTYSQQETLTNSGGKVVVVGDGFGAAYIDCFTQTTSNNAAISEDYKTVDCTFQYVDLRYDLLVYTEDTAELKFDKSETQRVALDTPYDDAYVYPFIDENIPITRTKKIICTLIATPLYEETISAGYWNGLRILMPDWHGGVPRHTNFTIDGIIYDAYDVDWYDTYANWQADGNRFFWWPEWLRSTVTNGEVDTQAATLVYASEGHGLTTPHTTVSETPVVSESFLGSAAKDVDGNFFLSASFLNGNLTITKLFVNNKEITIPKEQIQERVMDGNTPPSQEKNQDGSLKWTEPKESEYTVCFPIAPL